MPEDSSRAVHAETRKLAAIMFTDMVGFSRQMGADEARMLRLLDLHNQIIQHAVIEHHGTVIKTVGDAFLVDFPSVVHAVQCAQRIQTQFRTYNAEQVAAEQMHIRIGIHLGDILQRDGDVFGDGVNIASRLQALAVPDTICISDMVYREVEKKLPLGTVVSLGRPKLKNIVERFAVYTLLSEQPTGVGQTFGIQWLKLKQKKRALQATALVLGLVLVSVGTLAIKHLYSPAAPQRLAQDSASTLASSLPVPDKPSLVVLPFVNMSEDPQQEYFSDGITEDLTTALSQLSSLFVIARNSAFTYKGKAVKTQQVGRELGVRYVLEGSVRKADSQVRITAQLVDAATDSHLWAARYDRPLKDIFALQDEIVQKIVTTLKLQLSLWEQGVLVRKTTDNLEAYDYRLRGGEYRLRLTKEANAQARQMYEKALALDPQYAEAEALLGATYFLDWFLQWSPDPQNLERAFELIQKAVALNDALPMAHHGLSVVYEFKKQHELAVAEEERAIVLDPNYADAYVWLGTILSGVRRSEEGLELIKKGMRLHPRYPPDYLNSLGWTYLNAGRYVEAIAPLKQALSHNPNLLQSHVALAVVYGEVGREEEARAEAAAILRLNPEFSVEAWEKILVYKDPAVIERHLAALRKAGLK